MTTPHFCIPFSTAESTITIIYDDAADEVITVPAMAEIYNDLTGDDATDLLAHVMTAINAASVFTWVGFERPGLPYARTQMRMISVAILPDAPDYATSVTFSSIALAQALGFETATPGVGVDTAGSAKTSRVKGTFVRSHLWTPHSRTVAPLDEVDFTRQHVVLETGPPGYGEGTVDVYFTSRSGVIRIAALHAASAKESYRERADYLRQISSDADVSDPWIDWEAFAWAWLTTPGKLCKFAEDRTSPASTITIQAGREQLTDARRVLTQSSPSPLSYNLTLQVWKA